MQNVFEDATRLKAEDGYILNTAWNKHNQGYTEGYDEHSEPAASNSYSALH